MPGNVANVSRDSFDATKLYDKVTLQQGVPIPDSDWNEMNDVLRFAMILAGSNELGGLRLPATDGGAPGYALSQAGAPANNFAISAGWADVGGVLVPTVLADPPVAHDYTADTNRIGEGTVDTFAALLLTDNDKNWQAFHDLLSTAGHGACQVKFTSGAENGNSFNITAFTATGLTLSGGAPSPGDTYIVKPPALITPGGARVDEVFVQVFWEDINDNEDSVIQHPGLGVETAHREQRRWVVRVEENGTVPVTPSLQSFGTRYLKLATLNRTAAADVVTAEIANDTPHKSLARYQEELDSTELVVDPTPWTARAIQISSGGGLGNIADATFTAPTTLQVVLDAIDLLTARRRTYATLAVDAAAGRKADAAGQNAIDVAIAAGQHGPFLLNQEGSVGVAGKEFEVATNFPVTRAPVIEGEQDFGEYDQYTVVKRKSTLSGDIQIQGSFKRIYFKSDHASDQLQFGGGGRGSYHLDQCAIEAGHARFDLSAHDQMWSIRNTTIRSDNPGAGAGSHGMELIEGTSDDTGHGLVENCRIESTTGTGARHGIHSFATHGLEVPSPYGTLGLTRQQQMKPIVFRNCFIESKSVGGSALFLDQCKVPLLFENCVFKTPSGSTVPTIFCDQSNVSFRNCWVFTEESNAVRIEACKGSIDGMKIMTGTGTAVADPQTFSVSSTGIYEYNVRDVEIWLDAACFTDTVTSGGSPFPIISIGAHDADNAEVTNVVNIRGLKIRVQSQMGVQPILNLAGTNSAWNDLREPLFEDIEIDFNENLFNANTMENFSGTKAFIHMHGLSIVNGMRVSEFRLPTTDHLLENLVHASQSVVINGFRMQRIINESGEMDHLFRTASDVQLHDCRILTGEGLYTDGCVKIFSGTGGITNLEVIGGQAAGSGGLATVVAETCDYIDGLICETTQAGLRAYFQGAAFICSRLIAKGVTLMTVNTATVSAVGANLFNSRVTCVSQSSGDCLLITGTDTLSSGIYVAGGPFVHTGTNSTKGDFVST